MTKLEHENNKEISYIDTGDMSASLGVVMKRFIQMGIIFFILTACSKHANHQNAHFYTVQTSKPTSAIVYSGTIRPKGFTVITSPVDGVVTAMPHHYGEAVNRDHVIFMIRSDQFASDYKSALTQYVKSKNEFDMANTQFTESGFLHDHQLISDDEYQSKKSSYYSAKLSYYQSKEILSNLLNAIHYDTKSLLNVSINSPDMLDKAMKLVDDHTLIQIAAPSQGILLGNIKQDGEIKKVNPGDAVKSGDVLALVGDTSGFSILIKVSEMTINQIKIGQSVRVTGLAFQGELSGSVSQIDHQADPASAGLPTFSVLVTISSVPKELSSQIHVGMSAKVSLFMGDEPSIIIPLAAVFDIKHQSFVKQRRGDELASVPITTGKTFLDSVVVLSGLKSGDQIELPH